MSDDAIFMIMLLMEVFTMVGLVVFLYVIFSVCLKAIDAFERWLYKVFKEGKDDRN